MKWLTLEELRRLLAECSGTEAGHQTDHDILNMSFTDLGYDSLALIETGARIKQEFCVTIPDESLVELRTPRDFMNIVNNALAEKS